MEIPSELTRKTVEFLQSLPLVDDKNGRQALLLDANLDQELSSLISLEEPTMVFFQQLIPLLVRYGQLKDGCDAVGAILKAGQRRVGGNRKEDCDSLIQEWCIYHQQQVSLNTGDTILGISENQDHSNEEETENSKHGQSFKTPNHPVKKLSKAIGYLLLSGSFAFLALLCAWLIKTVFIHMPIEESGFILYGNSSLASIIVFIGGLVEIILFILLGITGFACLYSLVELINELFSSPLSRTTLYFMTDIKKKFYRMLKTP